MNYNEMEQQRLRDQAAARKKFTDSLSATQDAERKALNERAAASYQAAEAARIKEQTEAEQIGHEQALRAALLESYVKSNGSEFGFQAAYPALRAKFVEAQTLANVELDAVTSKQIAQRALDLRYRR